MKNQLIFICGPTAVGKTSMAVNLAQWLNTAIISFDSRQFYRELKIGSAPPDAKELAAAPHHFIGHLSVESSLSAGQFERAAMQKLDELFKRHNQALAVGGSGLYMKALAQGFDEMPKVEPAVREQLNQLWLAEGLLPLQKELAALDPEYFAQVDQQNPQRLIRALELIRSSGIKYSDLRQQKKAQRPFAMIKIGLDMPRTELYERINQRVDLMMEAGLLEEARTLLPYRAHNALQTVGYRELFAYFDQKFTLPEAVEEIKKNSRRYAKRQLTWFKRDEEIVWFKPGELEEIKAFLREQLLHN